MDSQHPLHRHGSRYHPQNASNTKLCSVAFVPRLVERALPGLPLIHLPVAPSAIRSRVDAQYFTITCKGPCFESISQTRQIGLYIPGDLPDPKPELYVIVES